jgi:hypothetical protein
LLLAVGRGVAESGVIAEGVVWCVWVRGARVVGRWLCIAIFERVEGFYRGGLCVKDVTHQSRLL